MRWLTLLTSLPRTPTRHRVGVWRKLQRMGASGCGAPLDPAETPETTELFQWLVQEIQSFRGEATLLRVDRIEPMTDDEIAGLFHKPGVDYSVVQAVGTSSGTSIGTRRTTAERSAARSKLDGLKRELDGPVIDT